MNEKIITIETKIKADLKKVWDLWTKPEHIVNWNFASADWHCPSADNDLRKGGKFSWRMEAKEVSMGFDFEGTYLRVEPQELIEYQIGDGRPVIITLTQQENYVVVRETFQAEDVHTMEEQKNGWQAILNNFKNYVESNSGMDRT